MSPITSRRVRAALAPAALCLAALATLGFPGCPDDATKPGGDSPNSLTMSNCWPNDDGRYWAYSATLRLLEDQAITYTPLGGVVPEVTLDDARTYLATPVTEIPGSASEYGFQTYFDGTRATESGVVAQNLVELFPVRAAGGPANAGAPFEQGFLERLALARPDLRPRLAAAGVKLPARPGSERDIVSEMWGPYFIHGYVWIKGPSWIGSYGDVDTILAWKFLESDIRPGHTFRHQLVPSLASDVWLNASVERKVKLEVPGRGMVSNAIEVLYLLDYGVSAATDEFGNVVGLVRWFDYGKVVYAPGTGPVLDLERRLAMAGETRTLGYGELRLDLTATGVVTAPQRLAAAGSR